MEACSSFRKRRCFVESDVDAFLKSDFANREHCHAAICACAVVCREDYDWHEDISLVECQTSVSYSDDDVVRLYGGLVKKKGLGQYINSESEGGKAMLSIKKALTTPEAHLWKKAIDSEYNKLVKAGAWREPTLEELQSSVQRLPVGIILSKKRSGSHKCRAVALGNQMWSEGAKDVFAPTLSMTAHRVLLVKAAREGDFIKCFDIDAAFLNAEININILRA